MGGRGSSSGVSAKGGSGGGAGAGASISSYDAKQVRSAFDGLRVAIANAQSPEQSKVFADRMGELQKRAKALGIKLDSNAPVAPLKPRQSTGKKQYKVSSNTLGYKFRRG